MAGAVCGGRGHRERVPCCEGRAGGRGRCLDRFVFPSRLYGFAGPSELRPRPSWFLGCPLGLSSTFCPSFACLDASGSCVLSVRWGDIEGVQYATPSDCYRSRCRKSVTEERRAKLTILVHHRGGSAHRSPVVIDPYTPSISSALCDQLPPRVQDSGRFRGLVNATLSDSTYQGHLQGESSV